MNETKLTTLSQLLAFVQGTQEVQFGDYQARDCMTAYVGARLGSRSR